MVDRNRLSQDDINALIAGGSIDRNEEDEEDKENKDDSTLIVDPNPPAGEGPLSKVINVTGMNISALAEGMEGDAVEEDAPAEIEVADDPPGPPPPPAPEVPEPIPEPAAPAVDLEPFNARIEGLEQALSASNAAVEQVKQEFQTVLEQLALIARSVEDTNRGLKATPSYRVRETFACGQCQSEKNLATPIKCTSCGKMNWWGWWPKEEEKHELEDASDD